jgi:transposase-like protein
VAQHFLLSAQARTLSLAQVARMSDEEAFTAFRALRWHATDGEPVCPRCGCLAVYAFRSRPLWKCKACAKQFSVTSGTIFHARKLPVRDYLMAVALFVNAAKGKSALELGRDLDVSYKTAFVLAHKLREALSADQGRTARPGPSRSTAPISAGTSSRRTGRPNRRTCACSATAAAGARVVVVMRERGGRTLPFVVAAEGEGVATVVRRVAPGSVVHADEARHWDACTGASRRRRINHSVAYATDEANTNQAESYFARLRRAEIGQHHHLSGPYLRYYAGEMAWREDTRREA